MSIFNSRIFLAVNAWGNTFQVLEIPNQIAKDIHINAGAIMPRGVLLMFSVIFISRFYSYNYIPEIWNFGDVMVLVWTPPPPHAKACVSRNCDTNARIKFIFDTSIDTLEWKNPIDFGENRKTKMAAKRPFCENMMKKLVHSITSSKMHRSTSYLI